MPMARRGRLRGRGLLVGGVFYLAYLVLVIGVVSGGHRLAAPAVDRRGAGILAPTLQPHGASRMLTEKPTGRRRPRTGHAPRPDARRRSTT